MPKGLPCPNPTCSHQFAAADVRGAAALTCPRCGTVYQFRGPRPARPEPPVPTAVPVATPVGRPPAGLAFEDGASVVVSPRRRAAPRAAWRRWLVAGLAVLALGGTAAGVAWWASSLDWSGEADDDARAYRTAGNFAFQAPRGWAKDRELERRGSFNLALKRRDPRGHMGLAYRDYKFRAPGDGELLDEALARLRKVFPQAQYDDPFRTANRGRKGELGGEPAIAFAFEAVGADEVGVRGECWMLTRRGYAYWLFFWGPEDDTDRLRPRWQRLRDGFRLLDGRDGWKPRARHGETVALDEVPVLIDYARDVWQREANPKDYDPQAVLALRGFEPTEDEATGKKRLVEYAGKAATVQVLVLPKAADLDAAVRAAREHVEKRLQQTLTTVQVEPIKDEQTGKPVTAPEVGAFQGRLDGLRLRRDGGNERYAVLAVVNADDRTLAIFAECPGERRGYWDAEFTALIRTVRPRARR